MKIAHVVRRYARAEWGGTETVVCHTVEEQRKLGHAPRVFCTNALGGEGYPYFYPYWPMPAKDKLKLDKKGGSPYSPKLFQAVREFQPDIIHIHAGGRLATASVKYAKELGIPCVISLHGGAVDVPPSEMEEMLRPLKGKFPYGGILDRLFGLRFDALDHVDAVICISHAEEKRLREQYPRQRIRYLPNGVDFPSNAKRNCSGKWENILCVSRIDYQKNQLALIELLSKCKECHLTLVGPVTAEWYAEKIRALVKTLHLEEHFTLIPGLPPGSPALEEQFAKADCFILPSVHEPFGIVALEAMARGLPLIASRVGGLPDFVREGENGLLFDPAQEGDLLRAFQTLHNPQLCEKLIAGGYKTTEQFRWPQIIGNLMEIYEECQKGRSA